MKLEPLCLQWGTWNSPGSVSHTTCLAGLDAISVSLWLWTLTLVIIFRSLTARRLAQEYVIILNFLYFFCQGNVAWLFHDPLSIISVSFQFQFCPLVPVDLTVQPPFSILWHPPPHVNRGSEKAWDSIPPKPWPSPVKASCSPKPPTLYQGTQFMMGHVNGARRE